MPLPVRYKGIAVDSSYRSDLPSGDGVVVGLEAVEKVLPVHRARLPGYRHRGGFKLGGICLTNDSRSLSIRHPLSRA
jgi:hypothetical protein